MWHGSQAIPEGVAEPGDPRGGGRARRYQRGWQSQAIPEGVAEPGDTRGGGRARRSGARKRCRLHFEAAGCQRAGIAQATLAGSVLSRYQGSCVEPQAAHLRGRWEQLEWWSIEDCISIGE